MADDLRTDLDQLLLQARQRPVFDRLGRRERAQEIAEIVGQRMKLEPDGIGGERPARHRVHLIAPSPSLGREPINLQGVRLARVRYAPDSDETPQRSEMSRWANKRHPLTVAVGAIFEGVFVLLWLTSRMLSCPRTGSSPRF